MANGNGLDVQLKRSVCHKDLFWDVWITVGCKLNALMFKFNTIGHYKCDRQWLPTDLDAFFQLWFSCFAVCTARQQTYQNKTSLFILVFKKAS